LPNIPARQHHPRKEPPSLHRQIPDCPAELLTGDVPVQPLRSSDALHGPADLRRQTIFVVKLCQRLRWNVLFRHPLDDNSLLRCERAVHLVGGLTDAFLNENKCIQWVAAQLSSDLLNSFRRNFWHSAHSGGVSGGESGRWS